MFKENPELYGVITVFIGSSIVERWDFQKYFADRAFINRGIGKDTSTGIRERFVEDVFGLAPKQVVIFLCSNDIKDGISAETTKMNLEDMLSEARQRGVKPLVFFFLSVLYEKSPALKLTHPEAEMKKTEKKLLDVCKNQNVTCVDLRESLQSQGDLSPLYMDDGIHLSEKGYEYLSAKVTRLLGTPEKKTDTVR